MPAIPLLTRKSRVAVAAPASAAFTQELAASGIAALKKRGLDVVTTRRMNPKPQGYLAGSDDDRVAEMNELFGRDDIASIFCLRGGYGSLRVLDRLDFDALKANPKLIVGYSDITALQLATFAETGVPSLSGPMVAPDWPKLDEASEGLFWKLASGKSPVEIIGPYGETLRGKQDGEATGTLIGGNLTMICSLLGTPYLPNMEGTILFVEDVGEQPYQIDRMFARLRLSGVLEKLGGLVFGAFTGAKPRKDRPSLALEEVLSHYASFVNGPVAGRLVYGHFPDKCTLPIGVEATLSASGGTASLVINEPVTRDV